MAETSQRWRARAGSALLVAAAFALALLAGAQRDRLAALPRPPGTDVRQAPAGVVLTTVVLGGFRGLLADLLWMRMSYLQDAGRYFELVQLSDWVTKLEPGFPEVWAFHAWNMTYNISAAMPDAESRWRWVENGIHLLRDKGIPSNPDSPEIFFELGWIFLQKIAGQTDSANLYYKARLATAMTDALGGGRPDFARLAQNPDAVRRLKESLALDLALMARLDREFGPLDWRLAESHALYWAWRGRDATADAARTLSCDRLLYESLAHLFQHGRMEYDPAQRSIRFSPAPELFEPTCRAFESAMARHRRAGIDDVYARFLALAARRFAAWGDAEKARTVFDRLAREFPSPVTARGFDAFLLEKESLP